VSLPPKIDGRRARTTRTHAAIVNALTDLLDEGHIEPTAAAIAERAGVAVRSVGQHFASREDLLLAVTQHHAQRVATEPIDPAAPLEARLERFVAQRARILEASMAMRRAAAVVVARSPSVTRALDTVARRRREETAVLFAREIAARPDPAVAERAVALVASGRAWDALRGELGLSPKAARTQLSHLIRAVLEA
jgi:TetR/AcrR family transcriptional regulator of autoinduction and epiphytic fitness